MEGSRSRSTRSTAWSSWRTAAPRTVGLLASDVIDCSLRTRVPGHFTPCGQDLNHDGQSCWVHEPDRTLDPSRTSVPATTVAPDRRARDLPAPARRLPGPL